MQHKEHIIKALGWSEQQYGQVVMDSAIAWINMYFKDEDIMVDVLTRSALFWKWWKNQWENRDIRFIEVTGIDLIDLPPDEEIKEVINDEYRKLHDIKTLPIKPNRMVTKDAWRILQQEIKKEKQALKRIC